MRGFLFLLLSLFLLSACAVPTASPEPTQPSTPTQTVTHTVTPTIQWFPETATPTARATRPLIPTPDNRPGISEMLLQDELSTAENWSLIQSPSGNVALGNQQITVAVASAGGYLASLRDTPSLADFYLEMDASPNLCKGMDAYGLILRAGTGDTYYRYAVTCGGLLRLESVQNNQTRALQDWVPSGQVPVGSPARLRLGVWAYGDEMRFFVNDVFQFSVQTVEKLPGQVGVFARSEGTTAVTVSFSSLTIYEIGSVPPSPIPTLTSPAASSTPEKP